MADPVGRSTMPYRTGWSSMENTASRWERFAFEVRSTMGVSIGGLPADAGNSPGGHPSFAQLMAEQGTGTITDISLLHGNFWPEEESIEEFLETLYEWRGRKQTDPAA